MKPTTLTKQERLRRCQILCGHFIRNVAYFRAARGDDGARIAPRNSFWIGAEANFIDMAILEWCKLFGDPPGKISSRHGWEYIVGNILGLDGQKFYGRLLVNSKLDKSEFEEIRISFRTYRDKFVAHLDDERTMHLPALGIPLEATYFLYDTIVKHAPQGFGLWTDDIRAAYGRFSDEARNWYLHSQES